MRLRRGSLPFRKVVPATHDRRGANSAFEARVALEKNWANADPTAPVPDIFVIGAMRAGTTTFCADLGTHRHIVVPYIKEPWILVRSRGRMDLAQSMYRSLYDNVTQKEHLLLDGSTSNSMLPQHPSVAGLAARLAPKATILYVVRDPVHRAISQYRHQAVWGVAKHANFDDAVKHDTTLIDYGRYWWQLQPWLAAFGADAIRVIRFEEYTAGRHRVVSDAVAALGLDPSLLAIDESTIFNQSSDARTVPASWRSVLLSDVYQLRVRHHIPEKWRQRLGQRVLPVVSEEGLVAPSRDAVERIIEASRQDAEALASFLGRSEQLWDFDATLRQFT